MEVFSRIQSHFQKIQDYKGRKYYCTMSAGYASYPEDSDDYQELLQYANYSLECSKLKGKNRLTVFTKKILESRGRKLEMTELLRENRERLHRVFSELPAPDCLRDKTAEWGGSACKMAVYCFRRCTAVRVYTDPGAERTDNQGRKMGIYRGSPSVQ